MNDIECTRAFCIFNDLLPAALNESQIPVFINFCAPTPLIPKCDFGTHVTKRITFVQNTLYCSYIRHKQCQRKYCQPSNANNSCSCVAVFAFGPNAQRNITKCHARLFSSQEWCMLAFGFNLAQNFDEMVQLFQKVNNSNFMELTNLQNVFTSKVIHALAPKNKFKHHGLCIKCHSQKATFLMADGEKLSLCFLNENKTSKLSMAKLLKLAIEFTRMNYFSCNYKTMHQTHQELTAMLHGRCRFYAKVLGDEMFRDCYSGMLHGIHISNAESTRTFQDPDQLLLKHVHIEAIRMIIWNFVQNSASFQKNFSTMNTIIIQCLPYLNVILPKGITTEQYKLLHIKNEECILVRNGKQGEFRLVYKPWKEANMTQYLECKFAKFENICHCITLLPPLLRCVKLDWKQKHIAFPSLFLYNSVVREFKNMWDLQVKPNFCLRYNFGNVFAWTVNRFNMYYDWQNFNNYCRPIGYSNHEVLLPFILKHAQLLIDEESMKACKKCQKELMLVHFEEDTIGQNKTCELLECGNIQGVIWKVRHGVFEFNPNQQEKYLC